MAMVSRLGVRYSQPFVGVCFRNMRSVQMEAKINPTFYFRQQRWYAEGEVAEKKPNIGVLPGSTLDWSDRFAKIGGLAGVAKVIAATLGLGLLGTSNKSENKKDEIIGKLIDEKEKIIEIKQKEIDDLKQERTKNEKFIVAAKTLGLVDVKGVAVKSLEQQAQEYEEAKKELIVVATNGLRMFDPKHKTNNPIPETIKKLLRHNVKVKIMIYDARHSGLNQIDKSRIDFTLKEAKKLKDEYPSLFDIKYINSPVPFHGDLIDDQIARIIPFCIKGIHDTIDVKMETYVDGSKLTNLKQDFSTMWDQGKEIWCKK